MPDLPDHPRLVLDLLQSVERDGERSQRDRASEFNIALGLVNAYLKYCIKKGYIKVRKVPARRYLYLLTAQGLAEKSRLSLDLVSKSLVSFRQARRDFDAAFATLRNAGLTRVALVGHSELAEIALICALNNSIHPVALVDAASTSSLANIPSARHLIEVEGLEGAIITDLANPQQTYEDAVAILGAAHVIAPAILGVRVRRAAA